MAKSGVWGRLDIKNPANCRWGDLRVQVAWPDLVRLAKKGKVELFRRSDGGAEDGKSSQMCKPRGPLRGEELKGKGYGAGS